MESVESKVDFLGAGRAKKIEATCGNYSSYLTLTDQRVSVYTELCTTSSPLLHTKIKGMYFYNFANGPNNFL